MNYRRPCAPGVCVSPLCLEAFNFGCATPEPDAIRLIHKALDAKTAAALGELFPPGTTFSDFHNSSGWMKMRVEWPVMQVSDVFIRCNLRRHEQVANLFYKSFGIMIITLHK